MNLKNEYSSIKQQLVDHVLSTYIATANSIILENGLKNLIKISNLWEK